MATLQENVVGGEEGGFEMRDDVGGRTRFGGDDDAGCECRVLGSARPDGPFCGTGVGDRQLFGLLLLLPGRGKNGGVGGWAVVWPVVVLAG
jgi:hypothetical protein